MWSWFKGCQDNYGGAQFHMYLKKVSWLLLLLFKLRVTLTFDNKRRLDYEDKSVCQLTLMEKQFTLTPKQKHCHWTWHHVVGRKTSNSRRQTGGSWQIAEHICNVGTAEVCVALCYWTAFHVCLVSWRMPCIAGKMFMLSIIVWI